MDQEAFVERVRREARDDETVRRIVVVPGVAYLADKVERNSHRIYTANTEPGETRSFKITPVDRKHLGGLTIRAGGFDVQFSTNKLPPMINGRSSDYVLGQ